MRYSESLVRSAYTQALISARMNGFQGPAARRVAYRTAANAVFRLTGRRLDPIEFLRLVSLDDEDIEDSLKADHAQPAALNVASKANGSRRMAV